MATDISSLVKARIINEINSQTKIVTITVVIIVLIICYLPPVKLSYLQHPAQ